MSWKAKAIAGLAGGLVAIAPSVRAEEDPSRILTFDNAPGLFLFVAPEYLPDGKPVDSLHLINRSKQTYCVRLEIAQQKFVHADRNVVVLASSPGVSMRATKVKFLMPNASYLPKYKAMPRPDGENWSWCSKAFKKAQAAAPVTPAAAATTQP